MLPQLTFIKCPHCSNNNILIYIDFKSKEHAYGRCLKRKYKSVLKIKNKYYYRGCGKEFKLDIKKKNG